MSLWTKIFGDSGAVSGPSHGCANCGGPFEWPASFKAGSIKIPAHVADKAIYCSGCRAEFCIKCVRGKCPRCGRAGFEYVVPGSRLAVQGRPVDAASCAHCGAEALAQSAFEHRCSEAGLILVNGNLHGDRGDRASVDAYRALEHRKGFTCGSCGKTYCMACLLSVAPPRAGGGKACPACGGLFQRLA